MLIHECCIDKQVRAEMLYRQTKIKLPKGSLPYVVVEADFIYGVLHFKGEAAIVEFNPMALSVV